MASLGLALIAAPAGSGAPVISPPMISQLNFSSFGGKFVTAGSDGAMWMLAENYGSGSRTAFSLVRISRSGRLHAFPLPRAALDVVGLVAGSDGNLWYADDGPGARTGGWELARVTPRGSRTAFSLGLDFSDVFSGITVGPDGHLWYTDYRGVALMGRLSPSGQPVTIASRNFFSSGNVGFGAPVTLGPDGSVWTSTGFRVTPRGEVTRRVHGVSGTSEAITLGADRALWLMDPGGITRLTAAGRATRTGFPASAMISPGVHDFPALTAGPDGNVWFVRYQDTGSSQVQTPADPLLGMITPDGRITTYPLHAIPTSIAAGPDGRLWIPEQYGGILRVKPQRPPGGWPAAARPAITALSATNRAVNASIACWGVAGSFCGGTLRTTVSVGRRRVTSARPLTIAAGGVADHLVLHPPGLSTHPGAQASITMTFRTRDFLGRTRHTRRTVRQA